MQFRHKPPRAIILAAGRGSRLGALVEDRPKCLIEFGGKALLEWQLDALAAAGIDEAVVIVGFNGRRVEEKLEGRAGIRTIHNPFYNVSDNLASLWLAREHFEGDVLVLNGDTLVSGDIVRTLLEQGEEGINVTVDRKDAYDDDDMKVLREGRQVKAIGKTLTQANAESIGMLLFRGSGTDLFRRTMTEMMYDPASLGRWFLSVVDQLAKQGAVSSVDIEGRRWAEVDFPPDVETAKALVASWQEAGGVAVAG